MHRITNETAVEDTTMTENRSPALNTALAYYRAWTARTSTGP